MIARSVGEGEGGAGRVVHRVRERDAAGRVGQRLLLEPARADHRDHPVPLADRVRGTGADLGPDRDDVSRHLGSRREREGGALLVPVLDEQEIGEVDPARAHPQEYLALPGLGPRNVLEDERLGRAVLLAEERLHGDRGISDGISGWSPSGGPAEFTRSRRVGPTGAGGGGGRRRPPWSPSPWPLPWLPSPQSAARSPRRAQAIRCTTVTAVRSATHPDGFWEQSGKETEGDEDHPLRAGRDPDPALRSQPLRPGADVAHQKRAKEGENDDARVERRTFGREAVGDGGEDHPLRRAVQGGVEERAEPSRLPARPGDDPVEEVQHPGEEIEGAGRHEMAGDDEGRRPHVDDEPRDRDLVGARADPVQQRRHRGKRLLEAVLERLPDLLHPGHRPPLAAARPLFVNSVRPERHGRLPSSLHGSQSRDHADPGTRGQPSERPSARAEDDVRGFLRLLSLPRPPGRPRGDPVRLPGVGGRSVSRGSGHLPRCGGGADRGRTLRPHARRTRGASRPSGARAPHPHRPALRPAGRTRPGEGPVPPPR